jgi:uncharacterized tellurite resistance protein B-like protein
MAASHGVTKLKTWILERFAAGGDEDGEGRDEARNLAVAALLVEVLRADYDVATAERRQVIESLREILGLRAGPCEELLAEAEARVDQAHDLHQFTSEINQALSYGEKLELVEQLWRVAQADAVIHKYEEHLIRRVAGLLHVSHRDFIAAKLRGASG